MRTLSHRLCLALLVSALVLSSGAWAKELTAGMKRPELTDRVAPDYTPAAKEAKLEGTVVLKANIGKDGVVRNVQVLEGLPMGLSEAAVTALYHWKFRPAQEADGTPAAVDYTLTFNFRLD